MLTMVGSKLPLVAVVDDYFVEQYTLRSVENGIRVTAVVGWTSVRWLRGRYGLDEWCNESLSADWIYMIDRFFFRSESDASLFLLRWGHYVD